MVTGKCPLQEKYIQCYIGSLGYIVRYALSQSKVEATIKKVECTGSVCKCTVKALIEKVLNPHNYTYNTKKFWDNYCFYIILYAMIYTIRTCATNYLRYSMFYVRQDNEVYYYYILPQFPTGSKIRHNLLS